MLQRPPQPLDEPVVDLAAPAIHADPHAHLRENSQIGLARELAPLICVGDERRAAALQRLLQGVVQLPGRHEPARPVHDGRQIQESAPHRYVGDVRADHIPGRNLLKIIEKIGVDPVAGLRLRQARPRPRQPRRDPRPEPGPWEIENRLHYVRDFSCDENRSRMRGGALPRNLARLANAAISIVRLCDRFRRLPQAHRRYAARRSSACNYRTILQLPAQTIAFGLQLLRCYQVCGKLRKHRKCKPPPRGFVERREGRSEFQQSPPFSRMNIFHDFMACVATSNASYVSSPSRILKLTAFLYG